MNTEVQYNAWIREIAKQRTPEQIKMHILKHATELFDPDDDAYGQPREWLASMYNLLRTFEIKFGVHCSAEDRLARLENHARVVENSIQSPR